MSILWKDLRISIPVKVKKITDLKIVQKCNEHAFAEITAVLEEEQNLEDIYSMNEKTNIVLFDKQSVLFSGVLMNLQISMIQGICTIVLFVKSYSVFMDFKKKKRSFQYEQNKYQSILEQIIKTEYQGDFIDTASNGKTQNRVIIQYDETDWEFLLRLASQLNTVVIPDILCNKPNMWIGLPNGETHQQQYYHYKITRHTDKYMEQKLNYKEKSLLDFTYLEIQAEQNYALGDILYYQNNPFVIIEKEMNLKQGKMLCRYKICKKESVFTNIFYNIALRGLSIDAKVIDVKQCYLKLHLCIDEKQDIKQCHWFQYNTPYAAEGQTGFYMMPQIGDSVKLYFPKEDETQAYVREVNRKCGKQNTKTKDTQIKHFGTIYNTEMILSPNSIDFIASEQNCSVNMNYSDGIVLTGAENIKINTDNLMQFEANKILVQAKDRIIASTSKANVVVDEIVHFKA